MLNGLKGCFVQSALVDSGFAGDPTSLACDNTNELDKENLTGLDKNVHCGGVPTRQGSTVAYSILGP